MVLAAGIQARESERGSSIWGRTQELLTQASFYYRILLLTLPSSLGQIFIPTTMKEGSFFTLITFLNVSLMLKSGDFRSSHAKAHTHMLGFLEAKVELSSLISS